MQRSDRPDETRHPSASSTIDAPLRFAERRGVTAMPDAVVFISTYNHVRFVRQTVESVLEQRTRFDVRIVIIDDFSTDGTRALLHELRDAHPHRIELVLNSRNLCSNRPLANRIRAVDARYVALLDGDDYWLAADKLQMQIDHLDANPGIAIACHNALICDDEGRLQGELYNTTSQWLSCGLEHLWRTNIIATCSALYRRSALRDNPAWYDDAIYGDWPMHILAARHGCIAYFGEPLAVYRRHAAGLWSRLSAVEKLDGTIGFLGRMLALFDESERARIRAAIVSSCYALADEHERHGDHAAANACYERARQFGGGGRLARRARGWLDRFRG
jgi:glycosyltransferase involved in cell wall biosynthesis